MARFAKDISIWILFQKFKILLAEYPKNNAFDKNNNMLMYKILGQV
jgi:hypothetical protein